MVCLGRPYNFKFFKGCFPQILLGPFLNTLIQMSQHLNQFQPRVAFHIKTSHLFCSTKQMTGFYMKLNSGLKWVKDFTKGEVTPLNDFCQYEFSEVIGNDILVSSFKGTFATDVLKDALLNRFQHNSG